MIKKGLSFAITLCMTMQMVNVGNVATANSNEGNYIINDQFDSDVDGWVVGAVDSSKISPAEISTVESYTDKDGVTANGLMKIEFTGDGGDWNSNTNQTVHRDFEKPYKYTDDTRVLVKTRVLQTGDSSRFSLLHNRPNTDVTDAVAGGNAAPNNAIRSGAYYYNDYLLFYTNKGSAESDIRYGTGYNPKGNILHTSSTDNLNNRWIDIEMEINGKSNSMKILATVNGKTEVATVDIKQNDVVYRNKYGTDPSGNPAKTAFDTLESLTFQQRNGSNTVYVDYVEVYEKVLSDTVDDRFTYGTDDWVVGAIDSSKTSPAKISNVSSYTDANGVTANGLLKVDVESAPAEYNVGGQPNIYKKFDKPFIYKDDTRVIVKTRVLHTSEGYGRFDLMHNRKNTIDTDTTGNSITDNAYSSHYTLFDVRGDKNNVGYPSSVSGNTVNITELVATSNIANKWIDVEMVIDGKKDSMTITTTVDGVTEKATTSIKQPKSVYVRQFGATPESGWTEPPQMTFDALESLTFLQRSGKDTIYIDYVEVYEMKLPIAKDVEIEGNVFKGEKISASYDFQYEKEEGISTYEWFSASSENGPWTKIEGENGKILEISDDISNKYIKFAVIPIGVDGMSGNAYESNVLMPERAPMVYNLRTGSSEVYTGMSVTALYEYSDVNGDKEGDTIVEWQVVDENTGVWTKFSEGKTITIPENVRGKYIKFVVTPVSISEFFAEGEKAVSEVYGPVGSILDTTNIFKNTGSAEITDKWEQAVMLEAGNRYIIYCEARKGNEDAEDITDFGTYILDSDDSEIMKDIRYKLDDAKINVISMVDINKTGEYKVGFMSVENCDAVVDNMYCGKLLISDVETTQPERVEIPDKGTVKVPVITGKIFNQLGTTDGLPDEEVVLRVDRKGVAVDGNSIVVDSDAVTGKLIVEVSCTPSYATTAQEEYIKTIDIILTAPENNSPRVSNVKIIEGETLRGVYEYYQVESKGDASEFKWIYSDEEDGKYYDIPGATQKEYKVSEEYKDKFIKFVVIPKTIDGLVGEEQESDALIPELPPEAFNITVSGDFKVGGTVAGGYEYFDINNDTEGKTTFKWYISDTENGIYKEIVGEEGNTLVLTEEMTDKYIKFAVIPVSEKAPENGEEVRSKAYIGPVAPYITDLKIKRKDNLLYAEYKYNHVHGATEGATKYEWSVNGRVVSNNASYIIDFTGNKTVTLTVIPVGDTKPEQGKAVSVSETVKGKTTTSGGGGGGSGSGSGGIAIVTKTEAPAQPTNTEKEEIKIGDLEGHWGAEYIKDMVYRGVMVADENGNYNPEAIVEREEMVTYLFRALKLETSEYVDIFEDVSEGEFAKMLQTMVNNGTISKDIRFRPDDSISRQEFCKIIYISLENAGKIKETEENLLNKFSDYSEISAWAEKYVNSIYGNKIMIGVSDSVFAPCGNITKAQVATVLTRMLALIEAE